MESGSEIWNRILVTKWLPSLARPCNRASRENSDVESIGNDYQSWGHTEPVPDFQYPASSTRFPVPSPAPQYPLSNWR